MHWHRLLILPLAMLAAFACSSSGSSSVETLDPPATPRTAPVAVADSLEPINRVAGSTFIEILEVVALADGRLIYCTGVRGLQVVDASDPAAMNVVAELRSSKHSHPRFPRCQHVAVDGDRVYFTNRGDMIQKTPFITGFDLSTSPPTEVINHAASGATIEGIAAVDGKVYVAMHGRGLAVMEPSGSDLVQLGIATGFKAAWSVDVKERHAYVADASGSLAVVDISNPKVPRRVASVQTGGSAQSVVVAENHAFVAAGAAGLVVVDISNPLEPAIASRTPTGGSALQVTVDGSRAFVANWSDARIYDVSKPMAPALVAVEVIKTEEPSSRVLGMAGRGDVAFVGEWTGMHAYRLHADRAAPHISTRAPRLDFDRTAAGKRATRELTIVNEGNAALRISRVVATGAGFSVDGPSAAALTEPIAPGKRASISVTFAPQSSEPASGVVTIESNDPDDAMLRIPISGNQAGLGVGDAAPPIELGLIDGGQWKLSEQRGKVVLLAYFATF